MILQRQRKIIKEVLNRHFTFADLSPRFKGVDSSTGNVFCPFHENHETPAAKMYFNEDTGLWQLHCFGECHATFTAYDYVDLVLCEKYQKYQSPMDFLNQNMDKNELKQELSKYSSTMIQSSADAYVDKIDYVNTTFVEADSFADFIEKLYTA